MPGLYSPVRADEVFFAGEGRPITYLVKQADGVTPQNMTGWSLEWVLYTHQGGPEVYSIQTADIPKSNGAGTNDKATITPTYAGTKDLATGTYWAALSRVDGAAPVMLAFGEFPLSNIGL